MKYLCRLWRRTLTELGQLRFLAIRITCVIGISGRTSETCWRSAFLFACIYSLIPYGCSSINYQSKYTTSANGLLTSVGMERCHPTFWMFRCASRGAISTGKRRGNKCAYIASGDDGLRWMEESAADMGCNERNRVSGWVCQRQFVISWTSVTLPPP